jgi:hypothetical protein
MELRKSKRIYAAGGTDEFINVMQSFIMVITVYWIIYFDQYLKLLSIVKEK